MSVENAQILNNVIANNDRVVRELFDLHQRVSLQNQVLRKLLMQVCPHKSGVNEFSTPYVYEQTCKLCGKAM